MEDADRRAEELRIDSQGLASSYNQLQQNQVTSTNSHVLEIETLKTNLQNMQQSLQMEESAKNDIRFQLETTQKSMEE